MAVTPRPTSDLKDKINVTVSLIRKQEATAEDFKEISSILEWIADWIDGQIQPNDFYKFHVSMEALIAAYPNGSVADGSWAVITPDGAPQYVATMTAGTWTASANTAPIQKYASKLALPDPGVEGVIYIVEDEKLLALYYNNKYNYFGKDGNNGASAYEVAVALGFQGTEQQWIDSIKESLDFVWNGTQLGVKKTADADFVYVDLQGPQGPEGPPGPPGEDGLSYSDETSAATSKPTPVDADVFGFLDSAASFVIKKFTWANLKVALKTYFDTLYAPIGSGGSYTPPLPYGTMQAMYDDQVNQVANQTYRVTDASGHSDVNAGRAWFEYKGTLNAAQGDYILKSEEESLNLDQQFDALQQQITANANNITSHNTRLNALETQKIIEVSTSRDLANTDHDAILLLTANVSLNFVPANLRTDFACELDADSTGQGTITDSAATPGDDLDAPDGTILEAGKIATIYRRPGNGKLRLKGEFIS